MRRCCCARTPQDCAPRTCQIRFEFPECSPNVLQRFHEYSLSVPWIFTEYSLKVHWRFVFEVSETTGPQSWGCKDLTM
jgi:hypothetical protein